MKRTRSFALLSVLAVVLVGCGSGSGSTTNSPVSHQAATGEAAIAPGARRPPTHRLLAVGSRVRDCDIVFDGPGPADWRRHSRWIGPYGLTGPDGPDFQRGAFEDGLLVVKTPTIVAGHRPVTISIPAALRYRAGILGVHPRPAFAKVTYVPCADKPRTVFAAGFLLRDRRPITLLVQVGNGPTRGLYLKG
jgi:hypothetical protein